MSSTQHSKEGGHLVVRVPNWVGDLVMATPVLHALAECSAWSRATILVRRHLAGVLDAGPWSADVRPVSDSAEEQRTLRELQPDAALLLTNSFGAAWRAWRAGIPMRAGAALSGRRLLLTHTVVPPTRDGRRSPIPTAHLLRDIGGLCGLLPRTLHPVLGLREEHACEQRERLAELGIETTADPRSGYVLCCPGAAFGAAKLWPPENFAAALDAMHERYGWRAVITGGPGEEPLMERVRASCSHPAISLADERRDLERLKPLVRDARLLLVGDSGPRWYAAAFDVPCVTLMGPNFPELTATSLELVEVVRRDDLECSPCLARTCPLGHHLCMTGISVERVLAATESVLQRKASMDEQPSAPVAIGGGS